MKFGAVAGADTFIDIVAEKVHRATLNGVDDVSGYDESRGWSNWPGWPTATL